MRLRKSGYPRRNINAADLGQAEYITGMYMVLVLGVLLCTQLQIASWRMTAMYLEDALAASNLASALIDTEEYGKNHKVVISDKIRAYRIYRQALKQNLELDEEDMCRNRELISGVVEVVDYVIYNVEGNQINAYRIGQSGAIVEQWEGTLGAERAPDGTPVEHTGIYSEVSFPVRGFLEIETTARKGKLVDIVAEEGEEYEGE